jgi:hypothetical protein
LAALRLIARSNVLGSWTEILDDLLMRLLKRLLQRLLILGLGIFSVWLVVFVFELVDRRLPWILALGIAYGIGAYIILPRAVRIGLKILKRNRVPSFAITGDGLPGDPVNVALLGTLQQLRAAFANAGWSEADRLGVSRRRSITARASATMSASGRWAWRMPRIHWERPTSGETLTVRRKMPTFSGWDLARKTPASRSPISRSKSPMRLIPIPMSSETTSSLNY